MSIVRIVPLLLILLWASLTTDTANAQTDELTGPPLLPDIAQIVERGTLIVGMLNEDIAPMLFTNEDGELAGFDIEVAKAMAKELGVSLEVRRTALSFDGVIKQVAAAKVDLGISSLSRSATRAKYVLFSRPYVRQSYTLFLNRVKGLRFRRSCPSVEELMRSAEFASNLGVREGSAYAAAVRDIEPDVILREFQSHDDLMEAVRAGEVAISLQGELAARQFMSGNPAARIHLRLCEIGRTKDLVGIAVPPGRYDLLNWVNVFLEDRNIDFSPLEIINHKGPWDF
ncbi:MAG: ABC transporter substrate-binding protein [Alphaproteobacteria bacterium]|nr:ABC transporter substrate-binding protein [Alphaproteobacteria bacterium]